jgi:hypothetical protein
MRPAPGRVLSGPGRREGAVCHRSGALIGVVEDQEQIVYGELVSVQLQLTDDGVVHGGGAAFEAADVVARPESAEAFAGEGELAHQFDESRVVDVVADGLSEGGDEPFCRPRPVLLERLLLRIEQQRPETVVPGLKARRERDREPVGCQHIERAPFHERGNLHARQELLMHRWAERDGTYDELVAQRSLALSMLPGRQ